MVVPAGTGTLISEAAADTGGAANDVAWVTKERRSATVRTSLASRRCRPANDHAAVKCIDLVSAPAGRQQADPVAPHQSKARSDACTDFPKGVMGLPSLTVPEQ